MGGMSGSNNKVGSGGGGTSSGGASGSGGMGGAGDEDTHNEGAIHPDDGSDGPQYDKSWGSSALRGSGDEEIGGASGSGNMGGSGGAGSSSGGASGSNLSDDSIDRKEQNLPADSASDNSAPDDKKRV